MEGLISGALNSKIGILVNEALSSLLKGLNGFFIPPVRIVSSFVIVAARRIESCRWLVHQISCGAKSICTVRQLMAADRTKCTICQI